MMATSAQKPPFTRRKLRPSSAPVSRVVMAAICLLPVVSGAPGFLFRLFQQEGAAAGQPVQKVVDLSHTLAPDTIFWPGFPGFNLSHLVEGRMPPGFWIEANWLSASEHGGTHVDAPAHFAKGAEHLADLPVDKFFGPGVMVDAGDHAAVDPDYQLGTNDLLEWERVNGQIPTQSAVLVRFGWSTRWPDRFRYFNSLTPDDTRTFRFPGVAVQALEWLVQQRNIKMIGVDVPSVDHGQTRDFEGHQFLCANRIPFVESLTNLDQLPARGMNFYAVPLRLVGGSGFPVRAFAVVSGADRRKMDFAWMMVAVLVVKCLMI